MFWIEACRRVCVGCRILLGFTHVNFYKSKDTDVWALKNNYVSVVPVQFDLTNHLLKEKLSKKWKW